MQPALYHNIYAVPTKVSILTRPGGRVQHNLGVAQIDLFLVSILTRPGGRVQLRPS